MHLPPSYNLATDIAVIGAAGRFPDAPDLDAFWANIVAGVDAGRDLTDDELRSAGVPEHVYGHKQYVRRAVSLAQCDRFDAAFFGYTAREAEIMNPEQRLLLECSQHALEDAGYDSLRYGGRIGAFVSVSGSHYLHDNVLLRPDLVERVGMKAVQFGNDPTFCATHVAYRLHLRGPAVAVQTACSTSLVAVHLACRSLADFECEIALAGGARIAGTHGTGYLYREGGILARDGYCRPFDSAASGTVSGSGVGVVVLKRLADALADGDHIVAVIKSTAVNNDGADKVGFSAPSIVGQRECIRSALERAAVNPEWIGYHEAHGTGTVLGDPIEIEAVTAAHRAKTRADSYCALGALKANVGHMGTAAGIGGFIKACKALSTKTIPPLAHFRAPNPALELERTPFRVPTVAEEWVCEGHPRFASVSAFGMGGTNAHAILCESPQTSSEPSAVGWHVWPVSAATPQALAELKENLRTVAARLTPAERADAAFTLSVGRRELAERDYLLVPPRGSPVDGYGPRTAATPKIAFVFPGQGAQYPGMAAACYAAERVYKDSVDRCLELLNPQIDFALRDLLLNPAADADRLNATDAAQCALFVCSYASAELWKHWGLVPAAMIGHSIGEYVAACVAGTLSLETALRLVVRRGKLMRAAEPGGLIAVGAAEEQLRDLLRDLPDVEVAAVNTPQSCVLAAPLSVLPVAIACLRERRVPAAALHTSHAFHSRSMTAAAEAFEREARDVPVNDPSIPYVSSLTGDWVERNALQNARYWARQMRERVRFAAGIERLLEAGIDAFVEVGPGQSMTRTLRSVLQWNRSLVLPSARHVQGTDSDDRVLAQTFGALWSIGTPLRPERRYGDERRRRIDLPRTAFARDRYWVERPDPSEKPVLPVRADDTVVRQSPDEWLYLPAWRRQPRPAATTQQQETDWLVFGAQDAVLESMCDRLREGGATVTRALFGAESRREANGVLQIRGDQRADYESLAQLVLSAPRRPLTIVYCCRAQRADPSARSAESELLEYATLLQGMQRVLELDDVTFVCVTAGGVSVAGEALSPGRAMLGSATRIVAQEFPRVRVVWLDTSERSSAGRLAHLILDEAAAGSSVVASRGAERWVPEYVCDRPARVTSPELRRDGCYLITGGLGGIGLAVAEHFARKGPVGLVLVSRTGLPPRDQWPMLAAGVDSNAERIRRVMAIERTGSSVMIASADVADRAAMQRTADALRERFGRCNGIVHAAGIVGGGMILRQRREDLLAALGPKVAGLQVLEQLLPIAEMDFVLLCSSHNALKGGVGRFGYAAANAYLDAYARARALTDERVVVRSLNWAAWAETGMAVAQAANANRQRQMFSTAEALAALDRVLAANEPQLVLSKSEIIERQERAADPSLGAAVETPVVAPSRKRPAQVRAAYAEPRGEIEEQISTIWTDVVGISPIGRDDDFFELGGNSLMMIHVGARIQDRFKVELCARDLFSSCTVRQLASHVAPAADATVAELCRTLEALSADDLDQVLARYSEDA
ncbi:MAG TPA: SDR family oxidoreductase [Polyangiaceae bacterium]